MSQKEISIILASAMGLFVLIVGCVTGFQNIARQIVGVYKNVDADPDILNAYYRHLETMRENWDIMTPQEKDFAEKDRLYYESRLIKQAEIVAKQLRKMKQI